MAGTLLTYKKIQTALEQEGGLVSRAADSLGVTRRALYHWFDKKPELKEYVEQQRELLKDNCVQAITEILADKKHPKRLDAAKFVLSRLGKEDGWSERIEHTGDAILPISGVTVNYGDGFKPPEDVEDIEHEEV